MNESTRLCNIAKTQPRTFWKTLKKCNKPNNKNTNAYIEVLSFDKVIKDAKLRNKILFDKLGI